MPAPGGWREKKSKRVRLQQVQRVGKLAGYCTKRLCGCSPDSGKEKTFDLHCTNRRTGAKGPRSAGATRRRTSLHSIKFRYANKRASHGRRLFRQDPDGRERLRRLRRPGRLKSLQSEILSRPGLGDRGALTIPFCRTVTKQPELLKHVEL